MSERKFVHSYSGQEIQQEDINLISENAASADDRVIAELFRVRPFDSSASLAPTKIVLGYTSSSSTEINGAIVQPSLNSDGKVSISPFRVAIGSTVDESDDAESNWKSLNSAVYIGASDSRDGTASFASNSSGNTRWDLVYANLVIDQNDTVVVRYIKNAISGSVTPTPIVITKASTVAIAVVTGTPSATPALPALPSDASNIFRVPLAYVRIPDGFDAATGTITLLDILTVCPSANLSTSTGANVSRPATTNSKIGVGALTPAVVETWANTGTRGPVFIPSDFTGSQTLFCALDFKDGSSANWSQATGSIVDNSRVWLNHWFEWAVYYSASDDPDTVFPWNVLNVNDPGLGGVATFPQGDGEWLVNNSGVSAPQYGVAFGAGHSFDLSCRDYRQGIINMIPPVFALPFGTGIMLYVTDTGQIRVKVTGVPTVRLIVRLTGYGPYNNR